MSIASVAAIGPVAPDQISQTIMAPTVSRLSFSNMLTNGIETVNQKVIEADRMAASFAIDDSIPPHQVTFALEEARLSFELMLQVRTRLTEAYQQLMGMQL